MTRATDPGDATRSASVPQPRRPDPRPREAGLPGVDGAQADPSDALAIDGGDDAGLLRLVGAVATALVVLAAAGSLLA